MNELKNEQHYQKQIQRKIWKMKALLLSYQFMLFVRLHRNMFLLAFLDLTLHNV